MNTVARHRATVDDLERFPPETRVQLIDGEFVMEPTPTYRHQRIHRNLFVALATFVLDNSLGEVLSAPLDVQLSRHDVYQPDILFISRDNAGIIVNDKIVGAPDLVIEILSPPTTHFDRKQKQEGYGRYGVREYWICDPVANTVEVYLGLNGVLKLCAECTWGESIRSREITGFEMHFSSVFA
jgi:Uma2 family endonuclease